MHVRDDSGPGALKGIPGKVEMFGLVRRPDGTPRIHGDPRNLQPQLKAMLKPGELEEAITKFDKAQAEKGQHGEGAIAGEGRSSQD